MNKITTMFIASFFLVAAAVVSVSTATAQTKNDDTMKHEKKYVVRVLTIEDGDTTVNDHAVSPDDGEFTWVDDDGSELKAVFIADDDDADMREDMTIEVLGKKKYEEYVVKSGKDGSTKTIFISRKHGDGHGDKHCCGGGNCCKMGMKDSDGMHGKMDKDHMKRMHEEMSSEEMKRMHEKMENKMMWREKKEADEDDDDDDENEDKDTEEDSDSDDSHLL